MSEAGTEERVPQWHEDYPVESLTQLGLDPQPSPVVDMTPQTLEIWCVAGHTWDLPVGKRAMKACPMHAKFFKGHFPPTLQPPKRVMAEWEDAQENLVNDDQYAARWRAAWRRIVRVASCRQMAWAVDMVMIEKYVRHLRLAELHRLYAQDEPYVTGTTGVLREHPGWKLAEREEREALRCADALGLEGPEYNFAGKRNSKKQGAPAKRADGKREAPTILERDIEAAHPEGILDSTLGPDGQPL